MTDKFSIADQAWLHEPALRRVLAALETAGGEARVAGGAVRNALMREPVAEIDIATSLKPEQVMAAGKAAGLGVHPIGIAHGTVMLTVSDRPFEVTTLRIDAETFGRKARVEFTDDWEADARRRDFTMNALYCDRNGKIFDPVKGYPDILRKRVRFVGDPLERIEEDHLRILRFFRFHARYGAGAPDPKGLKACIRLKSSLKDLSAERIRQELFKLLTARRAAETIRLMARHGILRVFLPHQDSFRALARMARIDAAQSLEPDALLRLHVIARDSALLKEVFRLSNHEGERLQAMVRKVPVSPRLRDNERLVILYQLGAEAWRDQVRLAWARGSGTSGSTEWTVLFHLADGWKKPRFPVSGADLKARGFAEGAELGRALALLEDWWVASGFKPTKDKLLQRSAAYSRRQE